MKQTNMISCPSLNTTFAYRNKKFQCPYFKELKLGVSKVHRNQEALGYLYILIFKFSASKLHIRLVQGYFYGLLCLRYKCLTLQDNYVS